MGIEDIKIHLRFYCLGELWIIRDNKWSLLGLYRYDRGYVVIKKTTDFTSDKGYVVIKKNPLISLVIKEM